MGITLDMNRKSLKIVHLKILHQCAVYCWKYDEDAEIWRLTSNEPQFLFIFKDSNIRISILSDYSRNNINKILNPLIVNTPISLNSTFIQNSNFIQWRDKSFVYLIYIIEQKDLESFIKIINQIVENPIVDWDKYQEEEEYYYEEDYIQFNESPEISPLNDSNTSFETRSNQRSKTISNNLQRRRGVNVSLTKNFDRNSLKESIKSTLTSSLVSGLNESPKNREKQVDLPNNVVNNLFKETSHQVKSSTLSDEPTFEESLSNKSTDINNSPQVSSLGELTIPKLEISTLSKDSSSEIISLNKNIRNRVKET